MAEHAVEVPQDSHALSKMCVCFRRVSLTAGSSQRSDAGRLLRLTSKAPSNTTHATGKTILKDVTGCFRPGEMTLVLGQPGSGKSALMKLLSGRLPLTNRLALEGDVTYNGVPRESLERRLPQFVSYVTQQDTHIPIMTVKETFQFAYDCSGGASETSFLYTDKAPQDSHASRDPDAIVAELGLQNCQDTIIGDAMLRGVSGGERKRVTTGEMQFGVHAVSLMDEISTGLDSAATFDIVQAQRHVARKWNKTVVISLLQPSPEVFALFDTVLLMNSGEIIYNGPRDQAAAYFESLGFKCPPRRDVADFLCDLASDAQVQYQTASPPAGYTHHPRTSSEFARIWSESAMGKSVKSQVDTLFASDSIENELDALAHVPEFFQGWWSSTWTLTKREMTVLVRNVPLIGGRTLLALFIGLLFTSLFFNMDLTNAQLVLGLIFSGALCLGLGQTSMLAPFMDTREVFYKQRRANFYRTSSFVVAASLGQIPLVGIESVIYAVFMYWPQGLVPSASSFLLYFVLLLLQAMVMVAVTFFLSSACPSLHLAEPISMISLLVFIITTGFMVVKDDMPAYMGWLYWVTPFSWGLQAMAITQYSHKSLDVCNYNGYDYCANTGTTMGKYSLSLYDMESDTAWIAFAIVFLLCQYLIFTCLSCIILEYCRFEGGHHHSEEAHEEAANNSSDYNLAVTPRSADKAITIPSGVHPPPATVPPVAIAFQDLWYSVPAPKNRQHECGPDNMLDLLRGITGYALPRTMTALMGSTGAGKTTLMDVIAARKTSGAIKGKILLNGHEASDLAVRRCAGYCEQMDVHSEATTFREALLFSAFLRQGQQASKEQILDSVNECLDLLGLHDIADKIVRDSSMEQMKRLTIGVELAAQPSVLFLDEPTSGLDARSAKLIMDGVRKVADSGRTVVCTIHQPSAEVFFLFDQLLLLQRGGKMVYFGELGHEGRAVIDYFESMPGVPKIRDGYNPATWMLEVIGAGVNHASDERDAVDFPAAFELSPAKQQLVNAFSRPGVFLPSDELVEVTYTQKRAASNRMQISMLTQRFFLMYWRTPSYTVTRYLITLCMAVVVGLMYLSADYATYTGVNGGLSAIYMANSFVGFVGYMSIFPLAFGDRASFYRERAAQTFNSLWYFVGFTLVEVPYAATTSLLFTAVFYPMLGFAATTGFKEVVINWVMMTLHTLFQVYLGQLFVFAFPSIEVAAIVGVFLDTVQFMFMGFNPPAGSIPSGYKWLYAVVPQRLVFDTHASLVFGQCSDAQLSLIDAALAAGNSTAALTKDWPLGCQVLTDAPVSIGQVTVQEYARSVFDVDYDNLAHYFGVYVVVFVVMRALTALSMRFINHQKR